MDELIGNVQTYELRRSSQEKQEIKRDRGLALKALEDDGSDLDDEEMAIITRKFKKFFKKARENSKKNVSASPEATIVISSLVASSAENTITI